MSMFELSQYELSQVSGGLPNEPDGDNNDVDDGAVNDVDDGDV